MPKKKFKELLKEDVKIREFLAQKLKDAGLIRIEIERSIGDIHITVKSARPGLVIGRGGKGVEELKSALEKLVRGIRKKTEEVAAFRLRLDIEELKKQEVSAAIVARNIAVNLEKRLPFRRTVKRAIEEVVKNKEVKGVKIKVKGRLDGAEISRAEWFKEGRVPLQTIRSDIDYAQDEAICNYGKIGIKVWIYKGEIFE